MTMSTVFSPEVFHMGSTETLPLGVDVAAWLGQGETPSAPASELRDLVANVPFPAGLSGLPSISGTILAQIVTGLQRDRRYLLVLSFTAGGKRESYPIEIRVDY